jgi:phage FluMu protein Com
MRVTCQHCGKVLTLRADKVPSGTFQLTCPACKKVFVVDRESAAEQPEEPAASPAASDADESRAGGMPKLRRADQELMSAINPTALVVNLGDPIARLEKDLKTLGMEEVRQFTSFEDALEVLAESGAGILVVRMNKASAPPCEPLEPLESLGYAERRRTFVVLVADNVKTLDGQVAFFLQVNCLINARDSERFSALVCRALLHDLRLYRYWAIETAS